MNLFEKIIAFLSYELDKTPRPYGLFHFIFLLLLLIVCIFIFLKYRHANDRQNNRILLFCSSIMLIFEVYKQLVFSFNGDSWSYQWYAFPFQFCSVPMYIAFITSFLKNSKIRDALYSFLGTFCLFAGLAVMFYPNDVFINTLGISIQTMVHHGLMVVIGFYCVVSKRMKIQVKSIYGAGIVFSSLIGIAMILNFLFRNVNGTFNMFFISQRYENHLPILSSIQQNYGYYPFLVAYIFGFIFVAYIILLIAIGINYLLRDVHIVNRRIVIN